MSAPEVLVIQRLQIHTAPSDKKNLPILQDILLKLLDSSETQIQCDTHRTDFDPNQGWHATLVPMPEANGVLMVFPTDTPHALTLTSIMYARGYPVTYDLYAPWLSLRSRPDLIDVRIHIFTLSGTYEIRYTQSEGSEDTRSTISWIPADGGKIETLTVIPWRDTYPDPDPPK